MLDNHLTIAGLAVIIFALSAHLLPNLLKNVKLPVVKEMVEMLARNRPTIMYSSLVVGVVAGLASYISMMMCMNSSTCVGNLSRLVNAPSRVGPSVLSA